MQHIIYALYSYAHTLILQNTDKYFSGDAARKMIGMPTSEEFKEIKRPDHLLDKYMIFVQDRGPGSRYLPKGSSLLIELQQEVKTKLYI